MSSARIIDGKSIAAALREELMAEVAQMPMKPGLAVILVGDDPASQVYVRNKIKTCGEVGIKSFEIRLPADCTQKDVLCEIEKLNSQKEVNGILLQLPVPDHLDSQALIQAIDPAKDVDGLTALNLGKLVAGLEGFVPCTPQGALMLIKSVREDLTGMNALLIGRSLLFGKPMAQLLLAENCTVTQAHSKTRNLKELCLNADILVAAIGKPEMVQGNWIKQGAVVIDVGINRMDDGSLCGDVDFEKAKTVAGAITPVPGGVGPMTIACLLNNTVKAAKKA